jgi:hypothetical protein
MIKERLKPLVRWCLSTLPAKQAVQCREERRDALNVFDHVAAVSLGAAHANSQSNGTCAWLAVLRSHAAAQILTWDQQVTGTEGHLT